MSLRAPNEVKLSALLALQAQARGLDLSSRKRVLTDMSGTHLSGFRGRGMEFEEHRSYQAGDDVRAIDWRVTARTGQAHIKRFREERERPVYLLADFSPSMFFATRGVFKSVLAAEALALLGWASVANRDRIGGFVATPLGLTDCRPAGGRRGLLQFCHQLSAQHLLAQPSRNKEVLASATIQQALHHVQRLARGGSVVVLMTDFQHIAEDCAPLLQKIAKRCELIVGMVSDPFERDLPARAKLPVTSHTESGQRWYLRGQNKQQQDWAQHFMQRQQFWSQQLLPLGSHWLSLDTAQPLAEQLRRGLGQAHRPQVVSQSRVAGL